jgi:hypothetical protein
MQLLPARAERREAVACLVTSHRGAAKFLPSIRATVVALWPGHPPLRFRADGGGDLAPDVLIEDEARFVPLLRRGLARLRAEFPALTHVFHVLEDHCPLRPCDSTEIATAMAEAASRNLAAVSFVTYEWPWTFTDDTEYEDGLVRAWRRIDVTTFGRARFAVVPRQYFRYFQLQPTLWRLDYLERTCAEALRLGVTDPWMFEEMQLAIAEQHYVSAYPWPTVHHGFLIKGKVNREAIDYGMGIDGNSVQGRLIRETIGVESERLYRLYRVARRSAGSTRRAFRRVGALCRGNSCKAGARG